jgi:DNA-binding SARP family transcriptional activator/tetratricopeptide (TPR) repeat protein
VNAPSPSWRLTTFGGLAIERVEERSPAAEPNATTPAALGQRRPLAVLAVLAASGSRGLSRDELLLCFWPDSNVERAKNALRQTIFRLRRDLGSPDPILGTDELQLNPAVVTSDIAEFEAALASGRIEHAVGLYHGPFLQAVSIGAAPEFDEWAATQRTRLAQRFASAVESLASAAAARGEHAAAITWWQRLAATDPTSSRSAVGLVTALAESGDRDGALQYCRLHELLLQEELGIAPDETVVALVNKLRAAPVLNGVATGGVSGPNPTETGAVATAVAGDGPSRYVASWRLAPRHRWLWLPVSIGALVSAVAIGQRLAARDETPQGLPSSPAVLAIFPFVSRGNAGDLGVTASDLLNAELDGMSSVQLVDRRQLVRTTNGSRSVLTDPVTAEAVARKQGAGQFLLGEVTATATGATVAATLYTYAPRPVRLAELSATGRRDDIDGITSDIARRLLASLPSTRSYRLTRSAALTTRSLNALKSYLDGEHRFQNGAFAPAVEAYRRAVAEDTTFGIAYYRLSVAADWASHPTLPTEALGKAVALSANLPEYEQRLVRALAAWRHGRGDEAIRLYRIAVSEYPEDAEAWYQLGEALYHTGPAYGQSVLEARPAFERAVRFRPAAREALVHLVRLAAKARDTRAVDSLTRRVIAMDPTLDLTELRLFRSLVLGQRDSVTKLMDSLRRSPDEAVMSAAWRTAVFTEDLGAASAIARLLIDPTRSASYQATGRWYVASLDLARGSWKSARAMLAPSMATLGTPNDARGGVADEGTPAVRRGSVDAIHAEQLGFMAAAMPLLRLSPGEVAVLRRRVAASPGAPPEMASWPNLWDTRFRDYVAGLLVARAGDTTAALRYADRLDRIQGDSGVIEIARSGAYTLRAQVAYAAGDRERALSLLDAASVHAVLHSLLPSRAYERFLRAELLRELGRDDEALRWYATQGQSFVPDMIYLAPAELRQAQIREQHGDVAGARAHYARFIELWAACDPELQPFVDQARERLRSLGAN